jgi:Ca2+-binding EF-hand superfamily protein
MSSYPKLTSDDIYSITCFFNYIDTDHDGFVTRAEIETAMAVDFNKDGVVTTDEKTFAGQQWFNSHFSAQDFNADDKITLTELLQWNNDSL